MKLHKSRFIARWIFMTTKADLGKIIYRPPIASFLMKSMRIIHLSITIFFLIFSLLEILIFYNYHRGLLYFLIFFIGLILSIVYPSGIFTVHKNGFDRNISLFSEKIVGRPRYFKFDEIKMITPCFRKQDDIMYIRWFLFHYGKYNFFPLSKMDVLFHRKYIRKIKKHFPDEWERLYQLSPKANEINWDLSLKIVKITTSFEDICLSLGLTLVFSLLLTWIITSLLNVAMPLRGKIFLTMVCMVFGMPILPYINDERHIVRGFLRGLVNDESERKLIPSRVKNDPVFKKWMNKNIVKKIQTFEEVDAIVLWK